MYVYCNNNPVIFADIYGYSAQIRTINKDYDYGLGTHGSKCEAWVTLVTSKVAKAAVVIGDLGYNFTASFTMNGGDPYNPMSYVLAAGDAITNTFAYPGSSYMLDNQRVKWATRLFKLGDYAFLMRTQKAAESEVIFRNNWNLEIKNNIMRNNERIDSLFNLINTIDNYIGNIGSNIDKEEKVLELTNIRNIYTTQISKYLQENKEMNEMIAINERISEINSNYEDSSKIVKEIMRES